MLDDDAVSSRNLDGYGAPTIEWARVRQALTGALSQAPGTGGPGRHTLWLATTNPDGTPHVRPIGAITIDGAWCFNSGPGTRKSRNLARDPRCTLTVATHAFDLVFEGRAERVLEPDALRAIASTYAEQGWPAEVDGGALTADFSAPSAGPPPWYAYRFVPATTYALGTADPYGATRFDRVAEEAAR